MSSKFPTWTKKINAKQIRGRDFLGIQNPGNRIMGELMPALTGATKHPRFYSFFSWAISASRTLGGSKNPKEQDDFLFRMENLLLYCSGLHKKHRYSMTGCRVGAMSREASVDSFLAKGSPRLPLIVKQIDRETSAFNEQNYRPSMNEMHLFRPGRFWKLSKERGQRLAEAFSASIVGIHGKLEELAKADYVSRSEATKLAEHLCPCVLEGAEQKLLRSLILEGLGNPDSYDLQRRSSLIWLLESVSNAAEADDPSWEYPEKMYFRGVRPGNGENWSTARKTSEAWALFHMRTLLQIGVTGLWSSFLKHLEQLPGQEAAVEDVVRGMVCDLEKSGYLGKIIAGVEPRKALAMSVGDLLLKLTGESFHPGDGPPVNDLLAVIAMAKKRGLKPGSSFIETAINERLDVAYTNASQFAVATESLFLLLALVVRWAPLDESGWESGGSLSEGGQERLSLRTIQQDMFEHMGDTLEEMLNFVMRRYVVDQHFLFATRKQTNTYHFVGGDRGIALRSAREGNWTSANYINAALQMLHALGLLDGGVGGEGYSLSKLGGNLLKEELARSNGT
ncbi:MAG: hypothetical protein ABIK28_18815 [Planctomycetota bacterium]